ncbi:MAG: YbaK/EbsC family protein [Betaproteobacteria bacterium]|nr:MAG: YbaK/EbsC family protein [Betaproteobacteria bacterium]
MAIATRVQDYLSSHGVRYEVLTHPHSHTSMQTAHLAHVPPHALAKSVVLADDTGFLMAVLPASHHVQLGELGKELDCRIRLADEGELARMFDDCEPGAVPSVGPAYGMRTVVDDSLAGEAEIYFESGDHEQLIRTSGRDFMAMLAGADRAHFAERRWHH